MPFIMKRKKEYHQLSNSEDGTDSQPVTSLYATLPWISTIVLLVLTVYLYLERTALQTSLNHFKTQGSFATGYSTDFGPAASAIKVEPLSFTGGPAWRWNGTDAEIFVPKPSAIDYAGPPHPEQDEAWEQLIHNRYFTLTEEEARATWPNEYKKMFYQELPNGQSGYLAGLDMFHTLHCLNQVRQMLWPEYYPPADVPYANFVIEHKQHCIDQIRQYIMCSGDLTPIPVIQYDFLGGFGYVNSDVPHTCRNFDAIRAWTDERWARMGVPSD